MYILQIEHPVRDYDAWKTAFDSDPIGRKQSGVRRYRILRPVGDPKTVMIHLEFESTAAAEMALPALRKLWGQVQGSLIEAQKTRIVELVESKEV